MHRINKGPRFNFGQLLSCKWKVLINVIYEYRREKRYSLSFNRTGGWNRVRIPLRVNIFFHSVATNNRNSWSSRGRIKLIAGWFFFSSREDEEARSRSLFNFNSESYDESIIRNDSSSFFVWIILAISFAKLPRISIPLSIIRAISPFLANPPFSSGRSFNYLRE